ncbi:MAG: uroporphyrinogen decarboxylase family protein [Puniceicoccaceae bacterium]
MLWDRESYLSHLCFGPSDREMVVELFGLLIGTEELWRQQGASEAEIDLTAFAWDRVPRAQLPFNREPINDLEEVVLREDEKERVVRDIYGRITVLPKQVATISLPQGFPVEEPEDWDRIREWFCEDDSRTDPEALKRCADARNGGAVVTACIWGAYDILRQLMGDENACLSLYEEPAMVRNILETVGEMQARCLEQAIEISPVDILFVHEDFAGKSGPLVGPNHIRETFKPYYEQLWSIARSGGARLFDLDSDGYIDPVVDVLLECGINCLHPVEPGAGSDIVALRKQYGDRLTLRGGIDKFALTKGRAAIDEELTYRLDPCLRGGGTMFALDHRIPSRVTVEAYRYYVKRLRQLLDLPPMEADEPGWGRMA